MGVDVATLVLRADTSDMKSAPEDLKGVTQAGAKTEAQARRTEQAFKAMGRGAGMSSHGVRMASLQLSQVAQQGQVTGDYVRALSVQLPDLLIGFGTLGAVAGVAAGALSPLIVGLIETMGESRSAEDAMEDLAAAMEKVNRASEIVDMTLAELTQTYGENIDEALRYAAVLAQNAAEEARLAARRAISGADFSDLYTDGWENQRKVLTDLAFQFQITRDEARELEAAFMAVDGAQSWGAQSEALNTALGLMEELGIEASDLPTEIRQALAAMSDFKLETEAAEVAMANLDARTRQMAQAAAERNIDLGVFGGTGEAGYGFPQLIKPEKPKPKRRSGGGSRVDPGLREAERLFDSTRTAAEKYADEIARVNELHEMFPQIVDRDVRDRALEQLKKDFEDLPSIANDATDSIRSAFDGLFDDPQAALENLGKELMRMALYAQLAQSMPGVFGAGGILPLMSFDGGGYTGSGSRTGGVDGRGGFPAVLHPNETVIDHTRASGGSGGGMSVEIYNYGPDQPNLQQSQGPDGREMLKVEVGKEIARGSFDGSMRGRYGANPQKVKR